MKHISESIIGRKEGTYNSSKTPGNMYASQDLEYGDIVTIANTKTHFIYLPTSQVRWWKHMPKDQDILVRFNSSYVSPSASYTCDVYHHYKFITHAKEHKNIKTPEDLKLIFDKYNIPYE